VVELTYYHDLSYPEIAALVGCPVNTVKARMARARHRLAPQLDALSLPAAPDPSLCTSILG
jgi:RNA polymerase sigma-70 factor (ECF subfamily)